MITKEKALEIATEYLKNKKIEYSSIDAIDDVSFKSKEELTMSIPYGKLKGEKADVFSVSFGQYWGLEERSLFIQIEAATGEVLYITTPHGFIDY